MSASPTARTLPRLRREGRTACVVERFNPHAKIRQDLFGFIGVRAIGPWPSRRPLAEDQVQQIHKLPAGYKTKIDDLRR
jgi:hypothetical protein